MSSHSQGSAWPPLARGVWLAMGLSLAAAVSLGITRVAYGLLLPAMRADLDWSYLLAGAMNTANAVGYLLGALSVPMLLHRLDATAVLCGGTALAALLMAGGGFVTDEAALLLQRVLAGVASAWVFVAGGVLAARHGPSWPRHGGLLLGLYYGGVGLGIMVSALAVPPLLAWAADRPHGWAWAWWALAAVCALAWVGLRATVPALPPAGVAQGAPAPADLTVALPQLLQVFAPALVAYALFGVGYIGYMTFIVALLRDRGVADGDVTLFYALLGLATLLPAVTHAWPALLGSGLLFGAVFLSVVASTTALVHHNLPPALWARGIGLFTIVFAFGQIVGPAMVGWIGDGPGGLERGLLGSAAALWLGAAAAWRQRALPLQRQCGSG